MNAPVTVTPAQRQQDIAARAASAFMLIDITVGTWSGIRINKQATAQAARAAHADSDAGDLHVKLLGKHHRKVKDVKSAYHKLRDYLYSESLPFTSSHAEGGQRRGSRLVLTGKVPEVLTRLALLKQEADALRDGFLAEYATLAQSARTSSLGDWGSGVEYPEADKVRSLFHATVSPPRAIRVDTVEDMPALPPAMAAEIAAAQAGEAVDMLETAKQELLGKALEFTERLARQLSEGKVLRDSLATDAKSHADTLRRFAEGSDRDQRLLDAADKLASDCLNAPVATWRNEVPGEGGRRDAAAVAAGSVRDTLRRAMTAQPAAPAPAAPAPAAPAAPAPAAPAPAAPAAPTPIAQPVEATPAPVAPAQPEVQLGGLLSDLWT